MVGTYSPAQITDWLVPDRNLFLTIHVLGVACFAYIVAKRLVPLTRAQRDFRFDRPLTRLGNVLKFWFGQWKHPRYKFAGTLHILIFAGFLLLAARAFSGADRRSLREFCDAGPVRNERPSSTTSLRITPQPSSSSAWWSSPFAASSSSQPDMPFPRSMAKAHTADAVFLLGLIATLMVADSLFAASNTAGHAQQGQTVETLAVLSLPWMFQDPS